MRRIDKSKILSTKYNEWLDQLNRENITHPESSIYKKDVIMNLLHCQEGLCAYTEMRLCYDRFLSEDNWKNGRYKRKSPGFDGDLEHFDHNSKRNKHWEWDNLFVSHHKANLLKSEQDVDDILKPDSPDYDPMALLEYEKDIHVFIPHTDIKDEDVRERVEKMIDVLQLNYDFFRDERESYLKEVFDKRDWEEPIKPSRFYTAFQMIEKELMEEE